MPLALKELTYSIPKEFADKIKIGSRVEVQLGRRKMYSAIVAEIHQREPLAFKAKPITNVLDEEPIVTETQIHFWRWIADYYLCSTGDVLMAALPSGLKLQSETKIKLHPDFNHDFSDLENEEFTIAEALSNKQELSLEDITLILKNASDHKKITQAAVFVMLEKMLYKKIVWLEEELIEKYKPKLETFVALHHKLNNNEPQQRQVFEALEKKAEKQLNLLMFYFKLSKKDEEVFENEELIWVKKSELIKTANSNDAILNALCEKEILQTQKFEVSRLHFKSGSDNTFTFSAAQQKALELIETKFKEKDVVLLHGETGSGKTLLYADLIKKTIAQGKQVLFMLPEIALTEHLIKRLQNWLGEEIAVYHSRYNNHQRVEIWNAMLQQKYKVVVGARSALFLPFSNLGLVICDEEHDVSYKQLDGEPHYHARDGAIYLAAMFKAKTLLGSATPALETWQNAHQNKYGLVQLAERFGNMPLPKIELIDLRENNRMKTMKGNFSWKLLSEIEETIARKEQVLLFQNRRGYSPSLYCGVCGWIPECTNCSVKLTYHKYSDSLSCHYCGFTRRVVQSCPSCGETAMKVQGFGTEKIEDELKILLPKIRVARMDADTMRSKDSHSKVLGKFEKGEIDVLIGTQMITKGLDFDNISLVGVLSADNLLGFPDFRVNERAYQILHQVAGRSGRKNNAGKVMIQALNVNHPVLQWFLKNNLAGFYDYELQFRQNLLYPPFTRLIHIEIKHKQVQKAEAAANWLHEKLLPSLGKQLLGPGTPGIEKMKNLYRRELLIKLSKHTDILKETKALIRQYLFELTSVKAFGQVLTDVDVDVF